MDKTSSSTFRRPKTCYFNDGKRRIDYVLVYLKEISENAYKSNLLTQYLNSLIANGFQLEKQEGRVYNHLVCQKVHAPKPLLQKYAIVYNIELAFNNPHYKYEKKIRYKFLASDVTKPNPESAIYERAKETLSGLRPTDFTSAERIFITNKLMAQTETGFQFLISNDIILTAYPLHDSPCEWPVEGPLSDRHLLAKFWANPAYFYKAQPLNLIEKYYGPEVAFYYVWLGFYTKMLIPAAVLGVFAFSWGIINFFIVETYLVEEEVCNSNQPICPICPSDKMCKLGKLKSACDMMKIAYILDNPANILYAIIMCFWGIIFMSKWKRKEAMMKMRWNLNEGTTFEKTIRSAFIKSKPLTKNSSITGQNEFYIPKSKTVRVKTISYIVMLLLLFAYVVGILLVVIIRLKLLSFGRESSNENFKANVLVIESFTSSILTYLLVVLFDSFRKKVVIKLTEFENPMTQHEFEQSYMIKLAVISISNTFFPLMYLAYIKGHSYTHPGDSSQWSFFGSFKIDVCKSSGCLVDMSIQLFTIMVMKNCTRFLTEILTPVLQVYTKKCNRGWNAFDNTSSTQWEDDYILLQAPANFIYGEYITMIVQYGMITFFVAALPFAPLLALFNNMFEIRTDAIKMLKTYRRIVPRRVDGLGVFNTVLFIMTILGAISNPLIIALTSNLIPRYIYRFNHGNSLGGFINSTLSEFATEDYHGISEYDEMYQREAASCFYYSKRYPPKHANQYKLTADYWFQLAVRCIFFIVLENVCLLFSLFLNYILPAIPRKVRLKLEYEQKILHEARLNKQ